MRSSVWPVLVAATAVNLVGHWLVVAGILVGEGGVDPTIRTGLVASGLAVTAAGVLAAAVATGRHARDGLMALAIGAAIFAAIALVLREGFSLAALTAGVATAAAIAVRRLPTDELWVRLMMATVVFFYVLWVTSFSAAFAVIIVPLLPYPTVGLSDFASEREGRRRRRSGYAAPE